MTSFASVAELSLFLQGKDISEYADSAQQALDQATEVIRDYTRQDITLVTNDTWVGQPWSTTLLRLPQRPVVSVTSITDRHGIVIPATTYEIHGADIARRCGLYWYGPLTVVYTHGYASVPGAIKTVCLQLASRAFENPRGIVSASEHTGSRSYPSLYAGELSRSEKEKLNRYRRRVTHG